MTHDLYNVKIHVIMFLNTFIFVVSGVRISKSV
jgi:hypothetical protein